MYRIYTNHKQTGWMLAVRSEKDLPAKALDQGWAFRSSVSRGDLEDMTQILRGTKIDSPGFCLFKLLADHVIFWSETVGWNEAPANRSDIVPAAFSASDLVAVTRWPAAKHTHEATIEGAATEAEARKPRILLVDDDDANREIVAAYLNDSGCHVDAVETAAGAVRLLVATPFDLVLMDIQMPETDGVAATKRIRTLVHPNRDIPIVALTAIVLPHDIKSFLRAGMDDHIGKPVERARLNNTIRRWLPRAKHPKEPTTTRLSQFNRLKLEEFVGVLSAEKVERIAAKFVEQLACAFKSTPQEAQREAHDLINVAGILGFDELVELCREIQQTAPHDRGRLRALLEEIGFAQEAALRTFSEDLLPELRAASLQLAAENKSAGAYQRRIMSAASRP
jgi:CheY-like chemotaxis protein